MNRTWAPLCSGQSHEKRAIGSSGYWRQVQPSGALVHASEYASRPKIVLREHLEHPCHPEERILRDDDGTAVELNAWTYAGDLGGHRAELTARGERRRLAQVEQHVQPPRAIGIAHQVGKMLPDLVEGHRPDAAGVDPVLRLVDPIGDGHTRHACTISSHTVVPDSGQRGNEGTRERGEGEGM